MKLVLCRPIAFASSSLALGVRRLKHDDLSYLMVSISKPMKMQPFDSVGGEHHISQTIVHTCCYSRDRQYMNAETKQPNTTTPTDSTTKYVNTWKIVLVQVCCVERSSRICLFSRHRHSTISLSATRSVGEDCNTTSNHRGHRPYAAAACMGSEESARVERKLDVVGMMNVWSHRVGQNKEENN